MLSLKLGLDFKNCVHLLPPKEIYPPSGSLKTSSEESDNARVQLHEDSLRTCLARLAWFLEDDELGCKITSPIHYYYYNHHQRTLRGDSCRDDCATIAADEPSASCHVACGHPFSVAQNLSVHYNHQPVVSAIASTVIWSVFLMIRRLEERNTLCKVRPWFGLLYG